MPRAARRRPTLALATATTLAVGLVVGVLGVPSQAAQPAAQPATQPAAQPAAPVAAPGPAEVWTAVSEAPRASRDGLLARVSPRTYAAYHLDLPALEQRLASAPRETSRRAPVLVEVPAPDGELVEFAVTESPVVEPGLAARHPGIATYAGAATGPVPASIRLDVTPMGFHASVRGTGAAWYVDPAYNGTDQGPDALYLSYRGSDLPAEDRALIEPEKAGMAEAARRTAARVAQAPRVGDGPGAVAVQRTYRLALVSDPSYAEHFQTTSDAVVTAEKVTLINRVNQVYGDDLSIRMLLVARNDALNFNTDAQFLGPNGRCGNLACYTTADIGCGGVIDTNRYVVGQVVGAESYDVGHIVFGPDGDGGGVAYLGAVGTTLKAGGCTGLDPPTGDGFAIDYVAHELGHQFAGNHTFNGTSGSCSGDNRNQGTSVEPGSGVTVMAYAGICGVDNLQPHSDPYFSQRSQQEVAAFTRSAPGAAPEVQDVALSGFAAGESFTVSYGGASTPTVTAGSNYTAAGLRAALEAAEPSAATATVRGLRGATFGSGANGFEVAWSGTADIATPTVTPATGTFGVIVGTIDNGGPEDVGGFANPAPTGNRNPVVTAPAARTIPQRTPFTLTGSATDPDGDALVYTWEQNDAGSALGGTPLNSGTKTSGPLFRVFGTFAAVTPAGTQAYGSPGLNAASTTPTRSFPDPAQVAAGETNAASGSCPAYSGTGGTDSAALRCYSEFLPVQSLSTRAMSFRLTARDLGGADGGSDGGTSFADTTVTVGTAGPFLVTSQTSPGSVGGGTSGTATWNVAGTGTATYATDVRISFSTDGGLTFPTVLVESTPNDGSAPVTWPNVATERGRIKVEAVGNYFYDVSDGNLTIVPAAPTLTTGGGAAGQTFTAASSDAVAGAPRVSAESNTVAGSAIMMTATGLPAGLGLVRATTTGTGTTYEVVGTVDADPGSYPVVVTVSDGAGGAADETVSFTVAVTRDEATVTYTGDTAGSGGPVQAAATVVDTDATPGPVAGTVVFTDQASGAELCSASVVSGAASCGFAAPATRTYQVVAGLTSVRYTGAGTPTTVVVVVPDPPDTSAPDTTITAGPSPGSIQLGLNQTFRFSSEPGATFRCSMRGLSVPCDDGSITIRRLAAGTYDFSVVAIDAAGNTDATPATRRFYVPVDDRGLTVSRGSWARRRSGAAYRGTLSTSAQPRATLTHRVTGATSLALVVATGRGFGAVDVFLGNRAVARVATAGAPRQRRVVRLPAFARPLSGTVRLVTTSGRTVRVDGLAVITAPAAPRPPGRPVSPLL